MTIKHKQAMTLLRECSNFKLESAADAFAHLMLLEHEDYPMPFKPLHVWLDVDEGRRIPHYRACLTTSQGRIVMESYYWYTNKEMAKQEGIRQRQRMLVAMAKT